MESLETETLLWVLTGLYSFVLIILSIFGAHRIWLVMEYLWWRRRPLTAPPQPAEPPEVLVQLPIFNERYVAPRLVQAVAAMDWPKDRIHIQILDDSTDDTPVVLAPLVERLRGEGFQIDHVRRPSREGYKAGALAYGLAHAKAEFVAIFDADFIPPVNFLKKTVPWFADAKVGMVQTRWSHVNRDWSFLTRTQAVLFDAHFIIEQTARHRSGCFFSFNGTAGIWRRAAIETAGGWHCDTVTEDMDLSYRAQLAGWQFVFLPETESPAELPVRMADFKTQQHRWTKGAIQTARKLWPTVMRAPIPLRSKIEATVHMLGNFCYPLMVLVALLAAPASLARLHMGWKGLVWLDMPIFILTSFPVLAFYVTGQWALKRNLLVTLAMVPAVIVLGIGISINNAWAVIGGCLQNGGEFVRTPKYGIQNGADRPAKSYTRCRRSLLPWLETAALTYSLAMTGLCALHGMWPLIPFMLMFNVGFGYAAAIGLAGWRNSLPQRLSPARA